MKTYNYEHGFTNLINRNEMPVILRQTVGNYNYVRTVDNEYFVDSSILNDSDKSCYKVVTLLNGERRNVNMNNGIAYKTNL